MAILEGVAGALLFASAAVLAYVASAIPSTGAELGNMVAGIIEPYAGAVLGGGDVATGIHLIGVEVGRQAGNAAILLCGLAALLFVGMYGMLTGRQWGRTLAMALAVCCIGLGAVPLLYVIISKAWQLPAGARVLTITVPIGIIVAVAGAVVLAYLCTHDTRRYFGGAQRSGPPIRPVASCVPVGAYSARAV